MFLSLSDSNYCIFKILYIKRLIRYLRNIFQLFFIARFFYRAIYRPLMFDVYSQVHSSSTIESPLSAYLIFGDSSRVTFSTRHSSFHLCVIRFNTSSLTLINLIPWGPWMRPWHTELE